MRHCIALALTMILSACSNQQIYNSTSELRAQQCQKLEPREREDCRARARAPYSDYEKARTEGERSLR